jgi:hypothetical protein
MRSPTRSASLSGTALLATPLLLALGGCVAAVPLVEMATSTPALQASMPCTGSGCGLGNGAAGLANSVQKLVSTPVSATPCPPGLTAAKGVQAGCATSPAGAQAQTAAAAQQSPCGTPGSVACQANGPGSVVQSLAGSFQHISPFGFLSH